MAKKKAATKKGVEPTSDPASDPTSDEAIEAVKSKVAGHLDRPWYLVSADDLSPIKVQAVDASDAIRVYRENLNLTTRHHCRKYKVERVKPEDEPKAEEVEEAETSA